MLYIYSWFLFLYFLIFYRFPFFLYIYYRLTYLFSYLLIIFFCLSCLLLISFLIFIRLFRTDFIFTFLFVYKYPFSFFSRFWISFIPFLFVPFYFLLCYVPRVMNVHHFPIFLFSFYSNLIQNSFLFSFSTFPLPRPVSSPPFSPPLLSAI